MKPICDVGAGAAHAAGATADRTRATHAAGTRATAAHSTAVSSHATAVGGAAESDAFSVGRSQCCLIGGCGEDARSGAVDAGTRMLQHRGWRQHVAVLRSDRTDLRQTRQGRIRGDMTPRERGRQGEADKTLQASVEHRITSEPGSGCRLADPQHSGMGRLNPDPVHS